MIVERGAVLKNSRGLHARPAAMLVSAAKEFKSDITFSKENDTVNAKSIMGVLMLAAPSGTTIHIRANGEDAERAIESLYQLIENEMEY
jgi:phosphotransferase system HPr (HPr) family protein